MAPTEPLAFESPVTLMQLSGEPSRRSNRRIGLEGVGSGMRRNLLNPEGTTLGSQTTFWGQRGGNIRPVVLGSVALGEPAGSVA